MNAYYSYDAPLLFDTPEQVYAFDKAYATIMKGPKVATKAAVKAKKAKKTK
jgi:hypothetical protein